MFFYAVPAEIVHEKHYYTVNTMAKNIQACAVLFYYTCHEYTESSEMGEHTLYYITLCLQF